MADIIRSEKPLAVSLIKTGQPLGAILASLGLAQAIPRWSTAPRAAAPSPKFSLFSISMTRCRCSRRPWIRPPRSWGPTAIIFTALDTLCQRHSPQAIVLLSTGLAEAQGSDIARVVRQFREAHPRHNGVAILTVNTPDFLARWKTATAR